MHKRIKIENVGKLVANLFDKEEYVTHIRNLKQALYLRLVEKNVHYEKCELLNSIKKLG